MNFIQCVKIYVVNSCIFQEVDNVIGIDQLLDVILKIESSGYTYYMNLSRRVQGKTAEILEKLADDERKHSDRFREIFGKIQKIKWRHGC